MSNSVSLKPNEKLFTIVKACNKQADNILQQTVIAYDPGETTGVAIWLPATRTIELHQLDTSDIVKASKALKPFFPHHLKHVRIEDYKVYGHKASEHAGLRLHTSELIGAIKLLCLQHDIPYSMKLAVHAKQFWTDDKLQLCNAYHRGMKHARDASRHLLFLLCWPI